MDFRKSRGMTKEIDKKTRNRDNTILRGKLEHYFIFAKMKFTDDFATDGFHVADSKLWKHAVQIRRALLRCRDLLLLPLKTERGGGGDRALIWQCIFKNINKHVVGVCLWAWRRPII